MRCRKIPKWGLKCATLTSVWFLDSFWSLKRQFFMFLAFYSVRIEISVPARQISGKSHALKETASRQLLYFNSSKRSESACCAIPRLDFR